MKILISGSTGLVGSALVPALQSGGHEVVRLVRSSSSGAGIYPLESHVRAIEH